jgi:hypothetical protein
MSRKRSLGAAAAFIGLGLLLRLPKWNLPLAIHHYGGGILWGAMLFALVAAVRPPGWRVPGCWVTAGVIAAGIEGSRLLHGAELDAFRRTLAGQLLLGNIFSAWNLAAYACGISLAALMIVSPRTDRASASLSA